ncbi:MAG: ATP-binding protein, partial [Myxococcales bacterium]|nr:ATP-binding protein [Myxococcales bacterium]
RGGQLTLRVERDGDDLVITVADTGQGIPEEIRGRIFGSFVTSGKRGGTGLGLSIVKKIVEEHHGRIDFESGPEGTKFVIRLPQTEPEGLITQRISDDGETLVLERSTRAACSDNGRVARKKPAEKRTAAFDNGSDRADER